MLLTHLSATGISSLSPEVVAYVLCGISLFLVPIWLSLLNWGEFLRLRSPLAT